MIDYEPCPKCNSYPVKATNKEGRLIMGGILEIVGLILLFISFNRSTVFLILAILICGYGGYKIYRGFALRKAGNYCRSCDFDFEYMEG